MNKKAGEQMTYQKIYIPVNEKPSETTRTQSNRETYNSQYHCPEIVPSAVQIPHKKESNGIFRLPLGKIIAVAALCAVSFAVGCSVTNDDMARTVEEIAVFSAGGLKGRRSDNKTTEEITFYEKYMTDNKAAESMPVEYLSVETTVGSDAGKTQEATQTEVAVDSSHSGKIGVDGETLYAVMAQDFSAKDVKVLSNQTKFSPDTEKLISKTPKVLENLKISTSEPLVLIVHTHGTECYNSYPDENYISAATAVRSENTDENVVGVGRKMASVLTDFGIPTIHSEKMCDKESFVNAYSVSYSEVKSYLEKYPSIRFVIDLHRDAIELADGTKKKPVFDSFGEKTAQLMFVVGTNQSGANHPYWQDNLSLALTLQEKIGEYNPGLFRGINLRSASFNQQLSPGYMLLECGSAANTLEEAETAAELFATGFAKVLTEYAV